MKTKRMRLNGTAVLTIDDDRDSRTLLKMILSEAGASVIEAASGAEALEKFKTMRPDVVLCDLRMPGMDGYEVLERIRALEPDRGGSVPMIAVTGFKRLEDYREALDSSFDFFLVKPVNPYELIRTTADLLGKTTDL
jgi:CheY-like chemotaxis protein